MIRNKILSTLAAFSLISCVGIVAAHAESTIDFVCVDNQINTKTFNVYHTGDSVTVEGTDSSGFKSGVLVATIDIEGFDGQVSSMSFTPATALSGYDKLLLNRIDQFYDEGYATIVLNSETGMAFRSEGNLLGTLTLNLNEGYGETAFELNVSEYAEISYRTTTGTGVDTEGALTGTLAVPAYTTGGGKVEVNATGALYDTYDDAPVYACAADEAVTVADITGKTLTWQVKDTEGVVGATIPVTVRTDVNGDGSVIFGLKIIGDENAEKLEKIDSAVLVIE